MTDVILAMFEFIINNNNIPGQRREKEILKNYLL
jgi:hypothetical protein